jgi:hypothetical protein
MRQLNEYNHREFQSFSDIRLSILTKIKQVNRHGSDQSVVRRDKSKDKRKKKKPLHHLFLLIVFSFENQIHAQNGTNESNEENEKSICCYLEVLDETEAHVKKESMRIDQWLSLSVKIDGLKRKNTFQN